MCGNEFVQREHQSNKVCAREQFFELWIFADYIAVVKVDGGSRE